jgi:hypothetical protein
MPPAAACRFSTASSYTPALQPSPGAHSDEASSGVQLRSPIGLLLTCGPRMERAPLGLNPELRTPPLPATHVRAETSLNTSSGLRHRCRPPSTSPLNTSDFVSHHLTDVLLIVELEPSQVPILHDQKDIRLFRPAPTLTSSVDPGSVDRVAVQQAVCHLDHPLSTVVKQGRGGVQPDVADTRENLVRLGDELRTGSFSGSSELSVGG